MTVFNCYMKITWKNIGTIIMYFAIFTIVSLIIASTYKDDRDSQFTDAKLSVGVVDRDKSEVSENVIAYLSKLHDIEVMKDDIKQLQEKMYYYEKDVIVQIPEGFAKNCISGDSVVDITQQPGQYDYIYLESQINDFMNRIAKYNLAGYSVSESCKKASVVNKSKVTLSDVNGNNGKIPAFAYLFRYFSYISIAILGNVLGIIVCSFRKKEVKNRIAVSAVPIKRQSAEALLAFIVIGICIWLSFLAVVLILHGKEMIGNINMPYYLLNSFAVMVLSLSIAFLTGIIAKKLYIVNMIITPVSLFMSFFGGTFVPLSVLNSTVRKVARFVPVFWYEDINDTLSSYAKLPQEVVAKVWCGIGIQMLFTLMFIAIALAVSRYQRQER